MDRTRSIRQLIIVAIALLLSGVVQSIQAQEETDIPVPGIFVGTRLVDGATVFTTPKGHLEIEILHRFGTFENGTDDLFGVYAPSNIAMGLNYGISERFDIQCNSEKDNKTQDLGFKYRLMRQSISGSVPLSISYRGNLVLDARDKAFFGTDYRFIDRLIFTHQLLLARQIQHKFNLLTSLGYTHFNSVDTLYQSDYIELQFTVGYKIGGSRTLFVSWQQPWAFTAIKDNDLATEKPNAGFVFGFQKASPGHNFQLFVTNRENISAAKNIIYTGSDFSLNKLRLGFNIRITLLKPKSEKNIK